MITLPFDAYLPLNMYLGCDVEGSVSTDDGTSHPYFRVERVRVEGEWFTPSRRPWNFEAEAIYRAAALASADPDILAEAMRIEGWIDGRPPLDVDALHDFRQAAE